MAKRKTSRAKLGTGARHRALSKSLAGRRGVRNPKALAAAIGRRKYGKARMAAMSAKGRKRKARSRRR